MKSGSLEMQGLSRLAGSLFARAQGSKVLGRFGDCVTKETQNYFAAVRRSSNLHVKKDLVRDPFQITVFSK